MIEVSHKMIFETNILLELVKDLTDKQLQGMKYWIDKIMIKGYPLCGSGVMLRVVDMNKSPIWLDAEWFKEYATKE